MANTVYDSKTVKLQDGTEVTLVPCAIGRLRRFMDAWKKGFTALREESEGKDDSELDESAVYKIYIDCAGIALEKEVKHLFEKTSDSEKILTDEYREWLEDVLDEPTILEILERCGNLKLNDPDFLAEAEKAAARVAGTN